MPQAAFERALTGITVPEYWQEDQNQSGHVFLNRDLTLAKRAAQFMQTGDPNSSPEPETEEAEDTGAEEIEDTGDTGETSD